MFDADNSSELTAGGADDGGGRPSRRQYTLKGVDAETIELMRTAASHDGMKIGSWVSARMREAAQKALARTHTIDSEPKVREVSEASEVEFSLLIRELEQQRTEAEQRFAKLERELHEITSGQRTIMTVLLNQR